MPLSGGCGAVTTCAGLLRNRGTCQVRDSWLHRRANPAKSVLLRMLVSLVNVLYGALVGKSVNMHCSVRQCRVLSSSRTTCQPGSLNSDGCPSLRPGVSAIQGSESEVKVSATWADRTPWRVPNRTVSLSFGLRPGRPNISGGNSPRNGWGPSGPERASEYVPHGGDIMAAWYQVDIHEFRTSSQIC